MGKLLDSVMKLLNDEKKVEEIRKTLEDKENKWEKFTIKYFNYFRNLSTNDKVKLVAKILKKYRSKEYIDREYKKCGHYEPREMLIDLLFEYAVRYGSPSESDEEYFGSEAFTIEDKIKVTAIYGQGTLIYVDIL